MIDMLPTSDPGGRPSGITAARPTSPRAASADSTGIDAASSGERPPSASMGSSAQPSGTHTTYFTRRESARHDRLGDARFSDRKGNAMPYAEGRVYYDA